MNTYLWVQVRERLREVGLSVDAEPVAGPDGADLVLVSPSGRHRYRAEVKTRISRESAAGLRLENSDGGAAMLLLALFVSESVADMLRSRHIDYIDAAGNMYLRWGATLVDVRGKRRTEPSPRTVPGRLFQPRGLQVIFVLLWRPELVAAPLRTISEAAGASLGTVKQVVDELGDGGFALVGDSDRQPLRTRQLFDRWVEAYGLNLSRRLELDEFMAHDPGWWQHAGHELQRAGVQLGGESAASRLKLGLRTSHAILYAEQVPNELALKYRWRRSADTASNVEVRRRFWSPVTGPLVPAPLIYADLMVSGDARQRDAATRLRETDAALRRIDAD